MSPTPSSPAVADANVFGHRNLPLLLLQARERVITRFRPALQAAGVTEQQWRIVRCVAEAGPLEPRQLVTLCAISSPSLAGVLARMDDLGLVTRKRLGHDARRLQVALTPKGRALARRLAPRIEAIYAEIEAGIGSEFARDFYRALDTLIQRLDSVSGDEGEAEGA
ncbi:MAG TPA: homoprotocatechuate degradation operon regulator HpaR [Rubrivivax sp.]|nr:homoprotocatechuate degradation operon regulator HpaR [Burkholderiales bacterium]HNT38070.1 homoprotocatechuate degradation operon regulator HpaR [Rubrivivax sp.]